MSSQLPLQIQKWVSLLGLKWPLLVEKSREKGGLPQFKPLLSLKRNKCLREKVHYLQVPPAFLDRPEDFLSEWGHELCHCVLAERVDPLFETCPIQPRDDLSEREQMIRAALFDFARSHEDLWVNDLRHEILGRELTIRDLNEGFEAISALFSRFEKIFGFLFFPIIVESMFRNDYLFLTAFCLYVVSEERYNAEELKFDSLRKNIFSIISQETATRADALIDAYSRLPYFSLLEREAVVEEILEIWQESVREVIKILFPHIEWEPTLIIPQGTWLV